MEGQANPGGEARERLPERGAQAVGADGQRVVHSVEHHAGRARRDPARRERASESRALHVHRDGAAGLVQPSFGLGRREHAGDAHEWRPPERETRSAGRILQRIGQRHRLASPRLVQQRVRDHHGAGGDARHQRAGEAAEERPLDRDPGQPLDTPERRRRPYARAHPRERRPRHGGQCLGANRGDAPAVHTGGRHLEGQRMKRDPERSRGAEPVHRKALTRERILRAAMELFVAKGFERTTIDRVANRAGVSRAAIFWHFTDKQTLFLEACAQLLAPFRNALEESVSHLDPEKRLTEMFDAYERFVAEHRDTIQAFLRFMIESPELRESLNASLLALQTAFTQDLHDTLRELLPPGHDPEALASGLTALLDGSLVLGLLEPNSSRELRRAGLEAVLKLIPHRPEQP